MKTTIDIPDPLFRELKQYAAQRGVSMRVVVQQSLQATIRGESPRRRRFKLKTITTKGEGLICDADWGTIRSLIYEGHGG